MYRSGIEYDEMAKMVIDVYMDYQINGFPIDVREVCDKLGVILVPYSAFSNKDRMILKKRSPYGFFVPPRWKNAPTIYYNDNRQEIYSEGCMRQTIFHELKHYLFNDDEDGAETDDLVEYFGKYFAAPTPYLIVNNYTNPNELVSRFGYSYEMACNASKNVINRIKKYDHEIFDYERPLIQLLDEDYYNKFLKGCG